MMFCEISIFCKSDEDPMAEFPHIYSAFADAGPATYIRGRGDLEQHVFTGTKETRTVTTDGLQSPVDSYLNAQSPKYPPAKLTGYRADHSIISAVDTHVKLLVYSIDAVDPDDYDSLPAAMQDMKPGDPIKEDVWVTLEAGLIAITPAENQDQVTAALGNWRAAHPLGTAVDFAIVLRNFTS